MGFVALLTESSTQAQTLKPLVIAVVFGLLTLTMLVVLVLLVLPALHAILHDLGLARRGGPHPSSERSARDAA